MDEAYNVGRISSLVTGERTQFQLETKQKKKKKKKKRPSPSVCRTLSRSRPVLFPFFWGGPLPSLFFFSPFLWGVIRNIFQAGEAVTIPALLISHADGMLLLKAIRDTKQLATFKATLAQIEYSSILLGQPAHHASDGASKYAAYPSLMLSYHQGGRLVSLVLGVMGLSNLWEPPLDTSSFNPDQPP